MVHAFESLNRIWEKSTRQNFKKWKLAATYARYHSTAKEHQGVVLDFHELTHMLNEAQEVEKNQENINSKIEILGRFYKDFFSGKKFVYVGKNIPKIQKEQDLCLFPQILQ